MANSVDHDQMLHSAVAHLVYTVCKGLSVPILRVIMVVSFICNKYLQKISLVASLLNGYMKAGTSAY